MTVRFIDPIPPRHFMIAAGMAASGYDNFARQYARILARDGVELEVRNAAGAVEDLNLLRDGDSGVQAALTALGFTRTGDEDAATATRQGPRPRSKDPPSISIARVSSTRADRARPMATQPHHPWGCWIFAGRATRSRSNNLVISTTEQRAALPYQGSARRQPDCAGNA